ncbi:MAG TPA: CO dehydrogenase/acetyl-CoA synthase complex subunit alpha [Methanothrix sp.]|nr:CO dehydrogenase/acetyl-CoA synthase complex subunit alpha [Methanothrix sp.]HOK57772.1 CO dehydrogenase/acetyl-CoA synthase complex subunit alpha [Methanothrix sp.]HOL43234.1 CO dehydrogenase/acetyl-CoA synthase complex subunit alpha [Methanothrix sp.]HPO88334.1 CO dehydrogenase/acetyl-CoA synthase complex subunit alpha [Methanothrix sp.]
MAKLEGSFTVEDMKNVQINIGAVVKEEEEWDQPMGPFPKPQIATLRDWDFKILNRYRIFYAPADDTCTLCTYGPCDLTGNKRGACGINMEGTCGKIVLVACLMGTCAHTAHGIHLYHWVMDRFGDMKFDMGTEILYDAPIYQTVMGKKPRMLKDFGEGLTYIEEQVANLLAATHTGQEGSYMDFESKALHAGMLDCLGMEICDMLQVVAYDMPRGDPNAPLVEIGMGTLDQNKAVLIAYGHNLAAGAEAMVYIENNKLWDKVDIGGVCCTAHDLTRITEAGNPSILPQNLGPKAKVAGAIGWWRKMVRAGIMDVVMVDEQCVWCDTLKDCEERKIPVIATTDKIMYGLKDRTNDPVDAIVDDLVNFRVPGVVILDPMKASEVGVKTAIAVKPKRAEIKAKSVLTGDEFKKLVSSCTKCNECAFVCPPHIRISNLMEEAAKGNLEPFSSTYEVCVGCGRCEQVCRQEIPILKMYEYANREYIKNQKFKMRAGRGPAKDTEIRTVGAPLVLGTIPGVIALVGCSNYPDGTKDAYDIAKEFVDRGYIVVTSGCMAMDMSLYTNEEGKTIWEQYPGGFDGRNICNVGSCVANSHIGGAAIKVATIFAHRNHRANWDDIADYILSKVGACGIAWGAYSQKAASIATGCNRLGIPVVVQPHSVIYRRAFLGRADVPEDWVVIDARDGSKLRVEPAPEHMLYVAETKEEAMLMMAKLCFRPSDNSMGRMIKLTHYCDISMKYFGKLPDDWPVYVRHASELPLAWKDQMMKELEEKYGWKIDWKAKKIVEGPIRPADVSFDPTNIERKIRVRK